VILTPVQFAQLREHLAALMDYAAGQRDCRPDATEADREEAHEAALEAASVLDLLDSAAAATTALTVEDWPRH
jgi:hypothetical protein